MKDAFLEEAEGHTIVIIFWEKCPKQSGGCHLVIGWRADDRSSAKVWRADERSSAVESSVECLVWFSRNRVQSIPKTTFQQGKNLGVNHWWHVGMGAKGISLPATWLGLVVHRSLSLSPSKQFLLFSLFCTPWKVGIWLSCWTPPTQSRTYLLADFAGGLCSKFTVYMQKWQCFFGPPQPPHLHIRVHRADSQLIKSDYLSYCCAVMCRKTFVFKTDCLSCFIHGTIYIRWVKY